MGALFFSMPLSCAKGPGYLHPKRWLPTGWIEMKPLSKALPTLTPVQPAGLGSGSGSSSVFGLLVSGMGVVPQFHPREGRG